MSFDEWLSSYQRPGEPRLNAIARAGTECDVSVNTIRKVLNGLRVSERVAIKLSDLTRGRVAAGGLS
jgi:hypothetical protein